MLIFFVVIAALISSCAASFLAWPVLRKREPSNAGERRPEIDAKIDAVEREKEFGLVGDQEAEDISNEIRNAVRPVQLEPTKAFRTGRIAIIAASGFAPIAAGLLYLLIGTPQALTASAVAGAQMPAVATGEDGEANDAATVIAALPDADRTAMIERMANGLAQRLVANPNDPDGWRMLARSNLKLERFEESASAWREALSRSEGDLSDWRQFAQALLGGAPPASGVSAELETALQKVLSLDNRDPMALFVLGQGALDRGDNKRAIELWTRLRERIPPDAPAKAALDKLIADAK